MLPRLAEIFAKCVASRLRRVLSGIALFIVLLLLLIAATPAILSTTFVQNRLKATLSSTLQGPVNWSSLRLSWRQGIELRNLTIGPAIGGLQQARITALDCRPGFGFGGESDASFGLELLVHLDDLYLELAPPAATAAPPPVTPAPPGPDPLTALAQGLDRFATLSFPLPLDLRVDVEIDPITIIYHDRASGRTFHFARGGLQVRIPSLERAPLAMRLAGKVQVDAQELGELRLATEISGLVAPSGRIVPAGALLSSEIEFPGITLKANGRLDQEQGVNGEMRLDLPQLQGVAAPFLPATLPQLNGTIVATLNARVDQEQNLYLHCTLAGRELLARGGNLPAAIGPLTLDFVQRINTDHQRQIVTFSDGQVQMQPLLAADWRAEISDPTGPQRQVSARLQNLKVDLYQTLALAAPFLPPNLPQISAGSLQLRDLDLQMRGTDGDGALTLATAKIELTALQLPQGATPLQVSGIKLAASDLNIPLSAYFPTGMRSDLSWQVADLQLQTPQRVSLQGLHGSGEMALSEIKKGAGEGRLSAKGRFDHQLRLQRAELTGLARLKDFTNDLHLGVNLRPDGGISVETLEVSTDIAALTATLAGKELQPLPIKQSLRIAGIELRPGGAIPAVKNIVFSVTSPGLVNVTAEGDLSQERLLTLQSNARLELPRLIALAGPLLPEKLTASGTISNELHLVATLPDQPLPAGAAPLRSAKNALALLKELSGSVQLDGVELRLPLSSGTLHLSSIQTSSPFTLRSAGSGSQIDLGGALSFSLRSDSVINGRPLPGEDGQLTFNAELHDWNRAFFAQSIVIEPLGVAQRSEVTISGLAALLDRPLPPSPATLLQRLDASLFGEVELHLRPAAPPLLPDLRVTGRTVAGTRIDLHAGESLRLQGYADIDNLELEMTKGPQLHGLQGHFQLERLLKMTSATTGEGRWLPLSTSLVQPLPAPLPLPLAGEKRRLHDDLRGSSGRERSLRIESLTLPVTTIPLTISALEGEIVTGVEEVGLNFLQAELLGGTLRARGLIDLRPIVPVLSAEAIFTNLDLARLGSSVTTLQPGAAESSISGEGSLSLPLLSEDGALLEGLTLSGKLRSIGARSFDRALASLDPYERNEAIMAQRKLLRLGQLQGAQVEVADGALSLSGAVSSAGVTLALPRIDRLRLAELPMNKELAPALQGISLARNALEFVRADTIQIGAQGEISLHKEEK